MSEPMDRGDYYEAKAAILDAQRAQMQAQAVWATAYATLKRLGVEQAPGYRWNDQALTIEAVRLEQTQPGGKEAAQALVGELKRRGVKLGGVAKVS